MSNELPIPPEAARDNDSKELARIWVAQGAQHVSLATEVWDDPAAWGLMLVDLARHIAAAYESTTNISASDALERIRDAFDAERAVPTDE